MRNETLMRVVAWGGRSGTCGSDDPQGICGVCVRGFGLNHSEQVLREGEIDQPWIRRPVVPGIECVGEVADGGCEVGADEAILDDRSLAARPDRYDRILELVGPATLLDSLRCTAPGGIVCNTGILGGTEVLDGFDPITAIPNGAYLTGFYSSYPSQAVMDRIFRLVAERGTRPVIGASFPFDRIADACALQDAGTADGKIVVTV